MATNTLGGISVAAAPAPFRVAERALWDVYGLEATEHVIELATPAVRLRVVEFGSGEPLLMVHGTGGPGTWPSLCNGLRGFRCLLLDRPGWGLSGPVEYARYDYGTVTADLLRGVLDGLGVDRAHVIGASIGNNWALRLAQRHPSRVERIVLMGGSPLVPEAPVPVFIRLLTSPAGALMVRVSAKPKMMRTQLRRLGHGASLDAGRIPEEFIESRVRLMRDTDSMRHERNMVRAVVGLRGYRPGLTLTASELRAIEHPTLLVFGTADPIGTADLWRQTVARLPRGELHLLDGGGHVPWFDAAANVAARVNRFLVPGSHAA